MPSPRSAALSVMFLAASLTAPLPAHSASLQDVLGDLPSKLPSSAPRTSSPPAASTASRGDALSQTEIGSGLKEALAQGTERAVNELGRTDGYLGNPAARIPVPQSLRTLESGMRAIGQGQMVDDFVLTMNRAAERAVPEAAAIFADAIRAMTVQDARQILQGPDDAATQYFRKTSGAKLFDRFQPIVKEATDASGATASYKRLTTSAGAASGLLSGSVFDLDQYVTNKALDGLFLMVGREEQAIRANPAARTTDILRKVFGGR